MTDRREQVVTDIAARTGITEAMIERLVRSFYVTTGAKLAKNRRFEIIEAAG